MPNYPVDSPEAMARVLVLMMLADASVDERELSMLDSLDAFRRLGLNRQHFMGVARDHCADLGTRMGEREWLNLSDLALIDDVLRSVQAPAARLLVARLSAAVVTADGRLRLSERLLFDHMLARWSLTRHDVTQAILRDHELVA